MLSDLLKEVYFYELDTREKIFNRLQLNFAAYVTFFTVVAYMARMIDYSSACWALTLFYTGIFLATIPISISVRYTFLALSGYKYAIFPSASESIKYKTDIEEYYNQFGNLISQQNSKNYPKTAPEMLDNYVLETLTETIDKNKIINEYRRFAIRKSHLHFLYSSIPLALSAFLFVAFDLDTSSPRKNFLTEDVNLRKSINQLTQDIKNMSGNDNSQDSQQKPPQPAVQIPPPPPRPKIQYSTEDYKSPLPDKSKLLNEGK